MITQKKITSFPNQPSYLQPSMLQKKKKAMEKTDYPQANYKNKEIVLTLLNEKIFAINFALNPKSLHGNFILKRTKLILANFDSTCFLSLELCETADVKLVWSKAMKNKLAYNVKPTKHKKLLENLKKRFPIISDASTKHYKLIVNITLTSSL